MEIRKGERIAGPFTSSQLKRLADSGKVGPNDEVSRDGTANWKTASSITGLFTTPPAAPLSTQKHVHTVDPADSWNDLPQPPSAQNEHPATTPVTGNELRQALEYAKIHERIPSWRYREVRRILFDEVHAIPFSHSKGYIDGCAMGCLLFPFILLADFYIVLPGTLILILLHKMTLLINTTSYIYTPLNAFMTWGTKNKLNRMLDDKTSANRNTCDAIRSSGLHFIDQAAILAPLVASADKSIALAEQEFSDNAYGPFWDAVAEAMSCLTTFNSIVTLCANYNREYTQKVQELSAANISHSFPPTLDMADIHIPDPRITLERLSACVRRGQTDFRFATIYEQKKSQRIALATSSSLEAAIRSLDGNISLSLANIASIMTTRY